MKGYSAFNVKDFVLCLGYKSEAIKDYFLNYHNRQSDLTLNMVDQKITYHTQHKSEDWQITFAETGLNAQTGARIFQARKYVENDDFFMLTYGDGVGDVNIKDLIAFHKSHGKLVTVTGARPPGRFGELRIEGNQVVGFNEKPQATEGWVSAGFFVCSRKALDYLTPNNDLIFEREPITNIVKDDQLMVYKHSGFWHPMDTSRDYHLLNQLWADGKASWKTWE
jgi:glucose-1-phosphate cytidylyltransferase